MQKRERPSANDLANISISGSADDPAVVADDISEARQLTAILRAIIVKARSSPQRG
jgi:hypothetical protein